MKTLLLSIAMIATFCPCHAQKKLVLYYSETGSTKAVAEELQKQLGADIEVIEFKRIGDQVCFMVFDIAVFIGLFDHRDEFIG